MALEWDMYSWNLNGWLRDEDLMVLEWDIYYWELNGRVRDGDREGWGLLLSWYRKQMHGCGSHVSLVNSHLDK